MPGALDVRPAVEDEFPALARLWHEAWHDAHDPHVPAALIEMRSYESFLQRLPGLGGLLRVAGQPGAPQGLCSIKGDELDQLFVAPAARGTGLAARLLGDGEARLRRAGVAVARLDCVIENTRAIRFYEKHGWARERIATVTLAGPFRQQTLILSKRLT